MPRESAEVISPGTASTSRPSSSARSAVISAPLRSRASTTSVACVSPATILLRAGNRHGAGSTPGAYSETIEAGRGDLGGERRVGAPGSRGRCRSRGLRPSSRLRARRGALTHRCRARDRETTTTPGGASPRARSCATERRRASRHARRRSRSPARRELGVGAPRTNSPAGGSWIVRSRAGNAGSSRAIQRSPPRREVASVCRARRRAPERANRRDAWCVDEMLAALGREDSESRARSLGQLPRRPIGQRLGEVLGLDALRTRERGDRRAQRARRARVRDPRAAGARRRASTARPLRSIARARAASSRSRAPTTRPRTASECSPGGPARSSPRGRGTVNDRSKRSSSARDSFSR